MVETIEVARRGQAGQAGTLFNLLNFILGAGALAVPQAFSLSGVALGFLFASLSFFFFSKTFQGLS